MSSFSFQKCSRALFLGWRMANFAMAQEEIRQNLLEPILFLKNKNYQEVLKYMLAETFLVAKFVARNNSLQKLKIFIIYTIIQH